MIGSLFFALKVSPNVKKVTEKNVFRIFFLKSSHSVMKTFLVNYKQNAVITITNGLIEGIGTKLL